MTAENARLTRILDPNSPEVADFFQLPDKFLKNGAQGTEPRYIAESNKVILRAAAAGHRLRSVLLEEKWFPVLADLAAAHPEVPFYTGSREMLESLTGFHLHRGALACFDRPKIPSLSDVLEKATRVVVLENLSQHSNVGAIFRSAAALGIDAVILSPTCCDPLYRRAIRVSMGSVLVVPWTRLTNWQDGLRQIKHHGFELAALELTEDSLDIDDPKLHSAQKIALIVGTEGPGITAETLAIADCTVKIPISEGISSLNVATASAIAFWELGRAR